MISFVCAAGDHHLQGLLPALTTLRPMSSVPLSSARDLRSDPWARCCSAVLRSSWPQGDLPHHYHTDGHRHVCRGLFADLCQRWRVVLDPVCRHVVAARPGAWRRNGAVMGDLHRRTRTRKRDAASSPAGWERRRRLASGRAGGDADHAHHHGRAGLQRLGMAPTVPAVSGADRAVGLAVLKVQDLIVRANCAMRAGFRWRLIPKRSLRWPCARGSVLVVLFSVMFAQGAVWYVTFFYAQFFIEKIIKVPADQ